jgi:predicted HTH domain antitoxin
LRGQNAADPIVAARGEVLYPKGISAISPAVARHELPWEIIGPDGLVMFPNRPPAINGRAIFHVSLGDGQRATNETAIAIPRRRTKLTPVSLTLDIPDDFAARLQTQRAEAEAQLHLELAVALYRQGQLPVANAASLAGLKLAAFEELLRARGVTMPYTLEDLQHDVAYASGRR